MSSEALQDERHLRRALSLAENCRGIVFYGVGAVIVAGSGEEIATGFTGETKNESGGARHAEECAILKARSIPAVLKGSTLYSTLEPCSERRSGMRCCADLIIDSGIARVVYGAREPFEPRLGIDCIGHERLESAGIVVTEFAALAEECLRSALARRAPAESGG